MTVYCSLFVYIKYKHRIQYSQSQFSLSPTQKRLIMLVKVNNVDCLGGTIIAMGRKCGKGKSNSQLLQFKVIV